MISGKEAQRPPQGPPLSTTRRVPSAARDAASALLGEGRGPVRPSPQGEPQAATGARARPALPFHLQARAKDPEEADPEAHRRRPSAAAAVGPVRAVGAARADSLRARRRRAQSPLISQRSEGRPAIVSRRLSKCRSRDAGGWHSQGPVPVSGIPCQPEDMPVIACLIRFALSGLAIGKASWPHMASDRNNVFLPSSLPRRSLVVFSVHNNQWRRESLYQTKLLPHITDTQKHVGCYGYCLLRILQT